MAGPREPLPRVPPAALPPPARPTLGGAGVTPRGGGRELRSAGVVVDESRRRAPLPRPGGIERVRYTSPSTTTSTPSERQRRATRSRSTPTAKSRPDGGDGSTKRS